MKWIQKSVVKAKKLKDHYAMHDINIYIKDPLPPEVDPDLVFSSISRMVPSHLLRGIDIIYVGQFDVFTEKDVNAVYQDSAIYVTNKQKSDKDMIDDIIHEIAHSVEEIYGDRIYNDNVLKREFMSKRLKIHSLLDAYNYSPPKEIRSVYHYDKEIDMYFYRGVGYDAMWNFVNGLFLSPYSVTSLREYFAIGFEEYFMRDKNSIKKICPVLHSKLENLEYMEER